MSFVLFFFAILAVYGGINFYIFRRGWQALPRGSALRPAYAASFAFVFLSFIAGRLIENVWLCLVSEILIWVGSFWVAAMIYLFLGLLAVDLARLVHRLAPVLPSAVTADPARSRRWTTAVLLGGTALLLAAGHVNAITPRHTVLEIAIPKQIEGDRSLRIVAASDIHLGTIIGAKRFRGIVQRINALDADLVLLPGDILDEDLMPVIQDNVGELLRAIRSRHGVVAVTGNHEYIGGVEAACRYLEEHGVLVLRDQILTLPNGVQIVGREDRSISRFTGGNRRRLETLMAGVDRTRPVLLMDHQPFALEEAVRNGVDLQISGHTHHGQLWPVNLVTSLIYEVSWGYSRKGDTHVYVSSGVGTWGPPVRIGSRPEIVEIRLRFQ
jgi:predicted MPP superfamily phosphohydrolase